MNKMLDKEFKSLLAKKWAVIQKDTDKYMNQVRKTIQNLEERQQHEWEIQHGNQDFWKKSGRNVGNENVFNGKKPKASSIV